MLLDKLTGLFSGQIGSVVESIGKTVDSFVITGEEKAKIKQDLTNELNRHSEEMAKLAQSETEAYLKDADSARNRELQIAVSEKAPMITKIVNPILAFGTVALTFILFYVLLFKPIGAEKDIIIYILGALTSIVAQIYSYYFGSSAGSKSKQEMMDKMNK